MDTRPLLNGKPMDFYYSDVRPARLLAWQPLDKGESLTLEIPVDTTGKFEVKAKFTMAPDYARIRLAMDTRPLLNGKPMDFYYSDVRPARLLSAGDPLPRQGETPLDDHSPRQTRSPGLSRRNRRDSARSSQEVKSVRNVIGTKGSGRLLHLGPWPEADWFPRLRSLQEFRSR